MTLPTLFSSPRKQRLAFAVMGCAIVGGWLATPESHSQTAAPLDARSAGAIVVLVNQIKTQQDQMVANQAKIETQTAALKEELRLLRIYSARGGGASRR